MQTKKRSWTQLSREEQVNVICDRAASYELQEQTRLSIPHQYKPLPNMNCYLRHKDNLVTCDEAALLLEAIPSKELEEYYKTKYEWSRITTRHIDWDAFAAASKKLKHKRTFLSKLCSEWLPTLARLKKIENTPDSCPLCGDSEDWMHLFNCTHRTAVHIQFILSLNTLLLELKTCPALQKEFTTGIKAFSRTRRFYGHISGRTCPRTNRMAPCFQRLHCTGMVDSTNSIPTIVPTSPHGKRSSNGGMERQTHYLLVGTITIFLEKIDARRYITRQHNEKHNNNGSAPTLSFALCTNTKITYQQRTESHFSTHHWMKNWKKTHRCWLNGTNECHQH